MISDARSTFAILDAAPADAAAIADLHADSWRDTYRGILPHAYLDHEVHEHRRRQWDARMSTPAETMITIKAVAGDELCGFACAFLDADARWGALLDNLHVRAAMKGRGIGTALLAAARARVRDARPASPMHLFVFDANSAARRFYERHGGVPGERLVTEILPGVRVPDWRYDWLRP